MVVEVELCKGFLDWIVFLRVRPRLDCILASKVEGTADGHQPITEYPNFSTLVNRCTEVRSGFTGCMNGSVA